MATCDVEHCNVDPNFNDINHEEVQGLACKEKDVVLEIPETVSNSKDSNSGCCTIS